VAPEEQFERGGVTGCHEAPEQFLVRRIGARVPDSQLVDEVCNSVRRAASHNGSRDEFPALLDNGHPRFLPLFYDNGNTTFVYHIANLGGG
jgi:hypothetical protein